MIVVLDGALAVEARSQPAAGEAAVVSPGSSAYLGPSRDRLVIECREPTRALLLGGEPFPETISMWWNFVARTHDEIDAAAGDWQRSSDRFGGVVSPLPRVPARGDPGPGNELGKLERCSN